MTNICRDCRIEMGFKAKDDGFHTAQRMICDKCNKEKCILPARHWIKISECVDSTEIFESE